MTNREKLAELSTEDFWQEINRISKHKATVYIDYVKFLDSEDSDITHFIKSQGECLVRPTTAEKVAAYIAESKIPETKTALLLGKRQIFDMLYAVVFMNNNICSVPFETISCLTDSRRNNND